MAISQLFYTSLLCSRNQFAAFVAPAEALRDRTLRARSYQATPTHVKFGSGNQKRSDKTTKYHKLCYINAHSGRIIIAERRKLEFINRNVRNSNGEITFNSYLDIIWIVIGAAPIR